MHGQQDREDLAGLAVEPGGDDFLEQYLVGVADDLELVFGDFAQYPHGQPGSGEWVTPDDRVRESEHGAQCTDLVFEELAEGFDELEAELFGEPADIVVELDVGAVAAVPVPGFDDIRVERALGEEVRPVDVRRGFFENLDEPVPDALAFDLRVVDAREVVEEGVACVGDAEVDLEVILEGVLDEVAFFVAQEPVVNEDAGELVADGFVQECGDDGGIHAARQAAEDALVANEFADAFDFFLGVGAHLP